MKNTNKIIPLTKAFGDCLVRNHPKRDGKDNSQKVSIYCKDFHRNGFYPVYRIVFKNKVRTYFNKTLKQMIGILSRLGY